MQNKLKKEDEMAFKKHWQLYTQRVEEETIQKIKMYGKIHFQSLSNERLYFIYYIAKYTFWFFGAYYLHNQGICPDYWFLVIRNNL